MDPDIAWHIAELSSTTTTWDSRVKSLSKLRDIVNSGSATDAVGAEVRASLPRLGPALAVCVRDPRSAVIREACDTIKAFASCLGPVFTAACGDDILTELVRNAIVTIAVVTNSSRDAARTMLQAGAAGVSFKVAQMLSTNVIDKKTHTGSRIAAAEYLGFLLVPSWLGNEPLPPSATNVIETAILVGCEDPSEAVRDNSRMSWRKLDRTDPVWAATLLARLPPNVQLAILNEKTLEMTNAVAAHSAVSPSPLSPMSPSSDTSSPSPIQRRSGRTSFATSARPARSLDVLGTSHEVHAGSSTASKHPTARRRGPQRSSCGSALRVPPCPPQSSNPAFPRTNPVDALSDGTSGQGKRATAPSSTSTPTLMGTDGQGKPPFGPRRAPTMPNVSSKPRDTEAIGNAVSRRPPKSRRSMASSEPNPFAKRPARRSMAVGLTGPLLPPGAIVQPPATTLSRALPPKAPSPAVSAAPSTEGVPRKKLELDLRPDPLASAKADRAEEKDNSGRLEKPSAGVQPSSERVITENSASRSTPTEASPRKEGIDVAPASTSPSRAPDTASGDSGQEKLVLSSKTVEVEGNTEASGTPDKAPDAAPQGSGKQESTAEREGVKAEDRTSSPNHNTMDAVKVLKPASPKPETAINRPTQKSGPVFPQTPEHLREASRKARISFLVGSNVSPPRSAASAVSEIIEPFVQMLRPQQSSVPVVLSSSSDQTEDASATNEPEKRKNTAESSCAALPDVSSLVSDAFAPKACSGDEPDDRDRVAASALLDIGAVTTVADSKEPTPKPNLAQPDETAVFPSDARTAYDSQSVEPGTKEDKENSRTSTQLNVLPPNISSSGTVHGMGTKRTEPQGVSRKRIPASTVSSRRGRPPTSTVPESTASKERTRVPPKPAPRTVAKATIRREDPHRQPRGKQETSTLANGKPHSGPPRNQPKPSRPASGRASPPHTASSGAQRNPRSPSKSLREALRAVEISKTHSWKDRIAALRQVQELCREQHGERMDTRLARNAVNLLSDLTADAHYRVAAEALDAFFYVVLSVNATNENDGTATTAKQLRDPESGKGQAQLHPHGGNALQLALERRPEVINRILTRLAEPREITRVAADRVMSSMVVQFKPEVRARLIVAAIVDSFAVAPYRSNSATLTRGGSSSTVRGNQGSSRASTSGYGASSCASGSRITKVGEIRTVAPKVAVVGCEQLESAFRDAEASGDGFMWSDSLLLELLSTVGALLGDKRAFVRAAAVPVVAAVDASLPEGALQLALQTLDLAPAQREALDSVLCS